MNRVSHMFAVTPDGPLAIGLDVADWLLKDGLLLAGVDQMILLGGDLRVRKDNVAEALDTLSELDQANSLATREQHALCDVAARANVYLWTFNAVAEPEYHARLSGVLRQHDEYIGPYGIGSDPLQQLYFVDALSPLLSVSVELCITSGTPSVEDLERWAGRPVVCADDDEFDYGLCRGAHEIWLPFRLPAD